MKAKLRQIDEHRFEVVQEGRMNVPGLIYATSKMIEDIRSDESATQVANVATLPGIVHRSIAMPDIHLGYGFPIGGVAAFDEETGVLSPGGVGYDINCGVRLLRSELRLSDVRPRLDELAVALHSAIPSGVGRGGRLRLSHRELDDVLGAGARWAVKEGYGRTEDLKTIEEEGCFEGADPEAVSDRAKERGRPQLGSLGSGNHFLEVGYVAEVFDDEKAAVFGLERGAITVLIHSGSRGLGYQVCDESLRTMLRAAERYGIALPDRQLAAAPLTSPEAQRYFQAMACAINYAFANRQMMTHWVRETFGQLLGQEPRALGLELVYDVCHNIAKWETHEIDGEKRRVCVHRKGATRAFGPGHPQVPAKYRDVGQPVLVPGDMGRYSFVLAGTSRAMSETFGSSCHGAGRHLSRTAAKKAARGRSIADELEAQGISVKTDSRSTIAEEMPEAYKDVHDVVDVMNGAGIAVKVAMLRPLAVVKG